MRTARSHMAHALCAALAAINLVLPHGASANEPSPKKECSVAEIKKVLAIKSSSLAAALNKVFSARCSTLENIARRTTATEVTAGRKLEPTKPLDLNAAQAQLKTARADPEFQAALTAELDGVTDETLRALMEIALLDDMDYAKARDLMLLELRKGGAK